MKKSFVLLVMLVFIVLDINADAVEIDGIYYNLVSKVKVAEVTNNPNKYSGKVEIPGTVKYEGITYNVTSIGNRAFSSCNSLTSIEIPNSVTSIGVYAFESCSNLTSITIPNSVTSISNGIFANCSGLTSIEIPNSVTSIGLYAFQGCIGLTSVTIPNSVTSIGGSAFKGCSSLTSITIPNSVTVIGGDAFFQCINLTAITIPNSVTHIEYRVFYECSNLTSIIIPSSVTSIDNYAFYGCSSLTSITIPNSVTSISNGVFANCSGLTSITIPNNVTSLKEEIFYGCSGLTSITIPNSVSSIEQYAFKKCSSLTSVIIGSGVTNIGSNAFASCPEIKDVYCYAEKVPNTKEDAFKDSYPEYATLYVPVSAINDYKTTAPWSSFKEFKNLSGEVIETKKCATPTISYKDGELTFESETEGVEFTSSITDADITSYNTNKVKLGVTYNISVYATKAGYDNSDIAKATLCWIDVDPKTEGISNNVASVRALAVMMQSNDNVLNITGAPEGSIISVYDLSGLLVGSGKAGSGPTSISTSLHCGEIAIVKIGEKSIKVILK